MNIFTSATKVVLILMILALIWLTFKWIIDWKDFVIIIMVIVNFYYNDKKNKEDVKNNNVIHPNLDV
jgi:hypothetical protein